MKTYKQRPRRLVGASKIINELQDKVNTLENTVADGAENYNDLLEEYKKLEDAHAILKIEREKVITSLSITKSNIKLAIVYLKDRSKRGFFNVKLRQSDFDFVVEQLKKASEWQNKD